MEPFEALTHRGRLRRLRRAAGEALAAWGLAGRRPKLLGLSENLTFRLEAPAGAGVPPGTYLFRVHDPRYGGPEEIRSELEWLRALAFGAELSVPVPQVTRAGDWIAWTSTEGLPAPRACSLTRWVEGRLTGFGSERKARLLGQTVARMHRHAERWQPPAGFRRPLWDWTRFASDLRALDEAAAAGLIRTNDLETLRDGARWIREIVEHLPRSRAEWGMIHADLHPGNCLFRGEEARPIDFSQCGFGHFVYDLGGALLYQPPPRRRACLEAYLELRPLPEGHRRQLEAGLLMVAIGTLAFHARNPREREHVRASAPALAAALRERCLTGRPWLFGAGGE